MLCKAGAAAAAAVRLRPSSQKPVALMRELLRVYTLPGALVLELACGTVRHRPLPQH
jgi:DNA modification methylase